MLQKNPETKKVKHKKQKVLQKIQKNVTLQRRQTHKIIKKILNYNTLVTTRIKRKQ